VAEPIDSDNGAPPPGEQLHLPGPSYLPIFVAFGVALTITGIVITWVLSVIGGVIAVIAIARWIRETREDMSELPLEH
jgi:Cytochrome c oxidase subunit IV